MPKQITRVEKLKGVTITVVSRESSFDVYITISAGTNLWDKRGSENCWIKFKTHKKNQFPTSTIKLKVLNQRYDKTKLRKRFRKDICCFGDGVCTISLAPTFYLSRTLTDLLKGVPSNKDRRATPGICTRVTGSRSKHNAGSRTPYSYNNAYKPYGGGSCTPK